MRVLELLAFTPMSAPQVATALNAQPRTVRRVLTRLVDDEYLTIREEGRRRVYEPTMRLVALAGQILDNSRFVQVVRPHLELVRERTRTTVHLLVPSYTSVLCIMHAEVPGIEPQGQVRELFPAHCTAGGKVLLAWRERWRDSLLDGPLEPCAPATIVSADRLREELGRVLDRKYATENDEYVTGQSGVAVPVLVRGEAVAAIYCVGTDVDPDVVLPTLSRITERLMIDLGRP